ncbi:gamma-glutamyltransferase family protein [Halomonas litopenaei]|uniref:gamma-glutamyltransferase family protein n=1 Tax=Halomonas litopenaei TaxID=2109328 RepID=UPI003FA00F26
MVATSQPLASQAGLSVLQKGGNAVDAAIATAATLTVVEPTSNGIGGDAFAIVWVNGELHGLNASGPSPQAASIESVRGLGHHTMPEHGVIPVTVPGAPAAWAELSQRFGRLTLAESLAPAITLAEDGFPISPTVSRLWEKAVETYREYESPAFRPWLDTFAPNGQAPRPGDMWDAPDHAKTLRTIADTNGKAFYEGELATQIDTFFREHGGLLRKEDLSAFSPEWVKPVSSHYRGHDIWEIPPNGCGVIALQALGILEKLGEESRDPVESLHCRIEATKLAYIDGLHHITDQAAMGPSVEQMLSSDYLAKRSSLIGNEAIDPVQGNPVVGGTVYLATADNDGNMVSFIQSNFHGFGSGVVVPGTGISLQNRGLSFQLHPKHANALAPGKRPYHTIIPGFITRGEKALGPFGVMGGFMQPQGHVQLITAMLEDRLNPQAALDLPRWKWTHGKTVEVEPNFPDHLALALVRRGHNIIKQLDSISFGRGQVILRHPESGVLCGGSEPRTDGAAVAW